MLILWVGIFLLIALIGLLGLPIWVFYIVAAAAGVGMGGVWTADRPYMLRLTPPARIGEFYGLYGMVGRFSAITGPLDLGTGRRRDLRRQPRASASRSACCC